ncbi:MAG: DUF1016 family protein [Bacteroidales bacterium]|nr:DUF1016 family protein [Bacteroidales bacterium]
MMKEFKTNSPPDLKTAVETIKKAILQGQYEAAKGVNRVQLAVYFGIGKYVSLHTRKGAWGTGALETISEHLRKELPGLKGYSATNLKKMRLFYEQWIMLDPKSSVATDELQIRKYDIDIYHTIQITNIKDFPVEDFFKVPFTHHVEIFGLDDFEARYYYIHRVAEEHLSVELLKKLIKDDVYYHQEQMLNNFDLTIPNAATMRKAVMMFKDSYFLDFINTEQIGERDAADVDERVVEQQIVQNVKNFVMTFGHDFAFIGNQQLLEIYGVEHFPDLLFFNRELNAMVVIELKAGDLKTSYLGQLMGYLTILDDKMRKPHENPSIGIILCKSANREYVEFMIRDYTKPMGVATYKTMADMPEHIRKALPDVEELKKLL